MRWGKDKDAGREMDRELDRELESYESMPKWEYWFTELEFGDGYKDVELQNSLDELGKEGWELVAACPKPPPLNFMVMLFLKRPKPYCADLSPWTPQ